MSKIPKVTHLPSVILIVLIESVVLILGVVHLAVNVPHTLAARPAFRNLTQIGLGVQQMEMPAAVFTRVAEPPSRRHG